MLLDPVINFGKVTVSIGYNASATSIVLTTGHGANLPATFSYNLVWWDSTTYADPADDPNVEIVRVTNRVTDTLTVVRAQEGTSATVKNIAGKTYKMILAFTKKMKDDIETASQGITLGTEQASTSGTAIDFTGIPAGTKKITIMFVGVSIDGAQELIIQIGDAGGIETTGYASGVSDSAGQTSSTAGFICVTGGVATAILDGMIILTLENSSNNTWVAGVNIGRTEAASAYSGGGSKALSAVLDRLRITTTGTPDDFDAGEINIQFE